MAPIELKSKVGQKVGPFVDAATSERIAAFVSAIGGVARAEVIPTFLTVCRKGEFELLQKLGIPLSQVLHGEQEYILDSPIEAGKDLVYETKLAQVHEKKSAHGLLQFMIFETAVRGVGVAKSNIILRSSS